MAQQMFWPNLPPGASPLDLQRQLPPGASPLDLQRQIPPPVPGQGGPSPPLPQGKPDRLFSDDRLRPHAAAGARRDGAVAGASVEGLVRRGAASSVGCGGRARRAQAAAGVASSDTPQSVTSELSAGSPASATAGTLSGADNTAESTQRSLADDATPGRVEHELILLSL